MVREEFFYMNAQPPGPRGAPPFEMLWVLVLVSMTVPPAIAPRPATPSRGPTPPGLNTPRRPLRSSVSHCVGTGLQAAAGRGPRAGGVM